MATGDINTQRGPRHLLYRGKKPGVQLRGELRGYCSLMNPTAFLPYRDGDLRIGWASWDDGSCRARSIKWAYRDKSGKISRGSPEIPFDILLDMVGFAADQGELDGLPELKAAADRLSARLRD